MSWKLIITTLWIYIELLNCSNRISDNLDIPISNIICKAMRIPLGENCNAYGFISLLNRY